MKRTVVGLMEDTSAAQRVVEDLLQRWFDKEDIGVVARDVRSESERVLAGTRKGLVTGVLAGTLLAVSTVIIPGFGPAFVAGPVGVLLAGTALGGLVGGLVAALKSSGVPEQEAHFYADGVRHGRVLVMVDAGSEERAARALEIMKQHGAAEFDASRRVEA